MEISENNENNLPPDSNTMNDIHTLEFFLNENKLLNNQLNTLTSQIMENKKEIFRLNYLNQIKENDLVIQQNKIQNFEKKEFELTTKFEKLIQEKFQTETDKYSLINNLNEINQIKEIKEKENKNLVQKIEALNNELLKRTNENECLNNEINELKIEKLTIHNNESALKLEITKLELNFQILLNDYSSIQNELINKQQKYDLDKSNQNNTIDLLNKEFALNSETFFNEKNKLNNNIIQLKTENQELKNKIQNDSNTIIQLRELLNNKDNQVENFTLKINEIQKLIIQKDNELNLFKELLTDKEREIKDLYIYKQKYDRLTSVKLSDVRNVSDLVIIREENHRISSLLTFTKSELEKVESINKELFNKVELLDDIENKYKELLVRANQLEKKYFEILKINEENAKTISSFSKEIDILNSFSKTISNQNQSLLFEIKLSNTNTKQTLLYSNLTEKEYDAFIYKSIEDLEAKNCEIIKRNLLLEKEMNDLNSVNELKENQIHEKNEIINNLEIYIKENESILINMKKKLDLNKFFSDSYLPIYSQNYFISESNNNLINELKELNNDLKVKNENNLKILNEFQNNENCNKNQINQIVNDNTVLQTKIIELERLNNNLKYEIKTININKSQESEKIQILEKKLILVEAECKEYKNNNAILSKEKQDITNNLLLIANTNNNKIHDNKLYMENMFKRLENENEKNKALINEIIQLCNNKPKENASVSNKIISNENIKEIIMEKEKDYIKLSNTKQDLEISNENLVTENSLLKYKLNNIEERINQYKAIIKSITNKEEVLVKAKKISVSTLSSTNDNNKTYSFNINQIITENELENKTDENIYDKYLNCLNQKESLYKNNLLLQNKIKTLSEVNNSLISADNNVYCQLLINKIKEMINNDNLLEHEIKTIKEEKDKIISDYYELNKENDKLKKEIELQIYINKELNEKNSNFQNALKEQLQEKLNNNHFINELAEKDKIILNLQTRDTESNNKIEEMKLQINLQEQKMNEDAKNYKIELEKTRSTSFKNFYIILKRAKRVTEVLNDLKNDLEDKVSLLANNNSNNFSPDFELLKNKVNEFEISKKNLSLKILEQENVIYELKKEINNCQENEKIFKEQIKAFDNKLPKILESSDVNIKSSFGKLLKLIHSSTNIITFKDNKIKELERDNAYLKSTKSESPELSNNVCNKCDIMYAENNTLKDNLDKSKNIINNLFSKNSQLNIQKHFVDNELKITTESIKHICSIEKLEPSDKNKTFSILINLMKRASKVIQILQISLNLNK